jgi:hypothetical protein
VTRKNSIFFVEAFSSITAKTFSIKLRIFEQIYTNFIPTYTKELKLAVLIDADNVPYSNVKE